MDDKKDFFMWYIRRLTDPEDVDGNPKEEYFDIPKNEWWNFFLYYENLPKHKSLSYKCFHDSLVCRSGAEIFNHYKNYIKGRNKWLEELQKKDYTKAILTFADFPYSISKSKYNRGLEKYNFTVEFLEEKGYEKLKYFVRYEQHRIINDYNLFHEDAELFVKKDEDIDRYLHTMVRKKKIAELKKP